MTTEHVAQALIAAFLALGGAMGEPVLQRAGDLLREMIADAKPERETAIILESVLAAVDCDHQPAAAADLPILFDIPECGGVLGRLQLN